jgi:yeast amino acid transporter
MAHITDEKMPAPGYVNESLVGPDGMDTKEARLGEGAEMYGDIQTAEEYGYVSRGLKSRHIQFIALGGTIGTGLFLGIGGSLGNGGPLSILLGYSLVGLSIYAMVSSSVFSARFPLIVVDAMSW